MKTVILYTLAVVGAFSVSGFGLLLLIAALAHHAEKRRRRDSQDALIAQYRHEGNPVAVAADDSTWRRYVEVQELDRIKTPRRWGR